MTTSSQLKLPPLSLYIHIPWCIRKCPYCDFNSHQQDDIPEQHYIDCLLQDLDEELPHVQNRELKSIFFGGGTPSIFSSAGINRILHETKKRMAFAPGIEITLEANPGTVEQEKFYGFQQAGINRLSIGVQSFQQQHLKALGRIHSNKEAILAVHTATAAGINNFNIDLMHGLPNQTTDEALADLQQAIDLKPQHISWYQLTIEKNTEFYKHPPRLPNDDLLYSIQTAGETLLQKNNFQQYEVSAFSKPGKQSTHNLNYWQFGDYIGIGAGAHGKITRPENNHIIRRQKTRLPKDYMDANKQFCSGESIILKSDLSFEFMLNALRLNQGVSLDLFEERTGLNRNVIDKTLDDLQQQSLLRINNNHIEKTSKGMLFLNDIVTAFL